MKDALPRTIKLAAQLLESEEESQPLVPATPNQVRAAVSLEVPERGLGRDATLAKVARVVELTPKTSSTRFYNQLFAGREPMAAAAEMLTGLLNTSMYTYKVAGVHTLIENTVVARLCALAGFEDGDGTFVPGGSMGNLVGLTLAAFEARPDLRDQGMHGPRLKVYLSADGHYSVRKNFGMMGLGRANVRRIPTDDKGRMRTDLLLQRIAQDRAEGHEPLCVVATAGTTVAGAFDPIDAIADIAEKEKVWLHVDGAFGGTFLLHPKLRQRLRGVERADSLTWNAHKMMGVPLPCAAVLVRKKGLLHQHFGEAADYLFQQDSEDLNLGTKSLQCGRRNDAFKLWAAWQDLGDDGWQRRIDRQLALLNHARARVVAEPNLELTIEPESLNLCFVVKDRSSEAVCEKLGSAGLAQVGYGVVNGRKVIRMVTVNPEVTFSEIDRFFDDLLQTAAALEPVMEMAYAP